MIHQNLRTNLITSIPLQTGLTSLADTVVGGFVGQGLSGGQKRRLCVALQMINLPSVLFLDEPTSGSDLYSFTKDRYHSVVNYQD